MHGNRRFSEQQEKVMIERYLAGENTVELGSAFETMPRTISNILKRNNIERRSNKILSKEQDQTVINSYLTENKTCEEIGKEFGVSWSTILLILIKNKIERRSAHEYSERIFTEEEIKKVIQLYQAGESLIKVGDKLDAGTDQVTKILEKNGIERRTLYDYYNASVDQNIFKIDSPERNYWLGFLMADGCVREDQSGIPAIVGLYLAIKDQAQVEKFADFCQLKNAVRFYPQDEPKYVITGFTSRDIAADLIKLNIIPRKTTKEKAPDSLLNDRDFWRGMIDGDGWVGADKRGYPYIGLCGSKDICEQFSKFVNQFIRTNTKVVEYTNKKLHSFAIACINAAVIIDILYNNSSVFLSRKKQAADKAIEKYKEKIQTRIQFYRSPENYMQTLIDGINK